jgi:cellulose synthase/poly-beta-1,6-N-acetylglucosamine synthase-like glycosyltransferase
MLALVLVPVGVLATQVIAGSLPRRFARTPAAPRRRVAVLVPAHDEAPVIGGTVRQLMPQLAHGDRVLVVADNCSDETAAIARAAGAEVIERRDHARRGKGYALDFGVRHIAKDPPGVVVFVDADCRLADGSLDKIARHCEASGRPVQALDLMFAPREAGTMVQVGQFAWVVRNQVRPLGCLRLGLPCQLMGTGMGLPWPLLQSLDLASGNIVEDMRMGLDCARLGHPPLFCPEALVTSRFPETRSAVRSQRTRWEHGHLAMILAQAPRLVVESLQGRGRGMLAMALDMCVPPVALLVLLLLALCVAAGALALATGALGPLIVAAGELALLAGVLALAWYRYGQEILPARAVLRVLPYVVAKIPLYLQFLFRRQAGWVRSRRDGR